MKHNHTVYGILLLIDNYIKDYNYVLNQIIVRVLVDEIIVAWVLIF